LGEQNSETAQSMSLLAQIYEKTGRRGMAGGLYSMAREARGQTLGPYAPLTLESAAALSRTIGYCVETFGIDQEVGQIKQLKPYRCVAGGGSGTVGVGQSE
jgi:hypothetical protein